MSSEIAPIIPEKSFPGSALIHGIAVLQHTEILNSSTGRSLFALAEFPLGLDEKKELNTVLAVLHYKASPNEIYPPDNSFCYICGIWLTLWWMLFS
ncbi:hypothetical protein M422DRAFT_774086 [Sphaerobolus stellatus SS14]|nr:hypothetical protein M422DRAFT_774086 [Sphaerobolus stellatus SS14]